MKHQLIELLKKANEGVATAPKMINELVREYQMASLGYVIFGFLLLVIATIGLIFLLKGFADKKEWAVMYDSCTPLFVILASISGTLVLAGIIMTTCEIGPALAPAWYMIKSLTS